jgi:aldehyde:ferredoxin oxidoreductase
MDFFGYAGGVLYVDLTRGEIRKEALDPALIEKFLGGWGINYKLMWDLLKPGTDPLSPENPIVLGAGPLVGTLAHTGNKIAGTTKFALPATEDGRHYVASGIAGTSRFGAMMKCAGYDHVVITGRAKGPAYLRIDDDNVELCDAGDLWGRTDVYEASEKLTGRHADSGVIAIGPAGENLVRFAMAVADKRRTLGRSGFGTVMGSKNLKAVVVRGTRGIKIADRKRLLKKVNELYPLNSFLSKQMADLGDHVGWASAVSINMNPGLWSVFDWDECYGVKKWYEVKKDVKGCSGCNIACHVAYEIRDGEFAGLQSETGHYMWPAVKGQYLGLRDHRESIKLLDMANRAGMCAITAGALVDWVSRLYADGAIDLTHTDGSPLGRDIHAYIRLTERMINREGDLGKAMADGWFAISRHVGKDAGTDYVQGFGIAKGTDCIFPARTSKLDPQRFTMGVTNPRGGHSPQGNSLSSSPLLPLETLRNDALAWGTPAEAVERIFQPVPYYGAFNCGRLTRHVEDFYSLQCCLGTCTLQAIAGLVSINDFAELYSAATGMETGPEELRRRSERVYNLYKLLNVREGFGRAEDAAFPEVWLTPIDTPDRREALTDYHRIRELTREDILKLLDDYYDERGWDPAKGTPSREKLTELGLENPQR